MQFVQMFGTSYLSRSETHHVGFFWFFQLESIHLIRPGGVRMPEILAVAEVC